MRLRFILALVALACVARADDSFTKSLSPEDFQAAGLQKLSPEELAKLDALISGKQEGVVAQAKAETTKVVTATVRQQVQAEDKAAAAKQAPSSFLGKVKVLLTPGTQIEYTTLDTAILPPFHGWEDGTVFLLSNGQRWVVHDDTSYWAPKTDKPVHAKIVPGSMGSFFMEIDHGGRPRVRFLSGPVAPTPTPTPAAP